MYPTDWKHQQCCKSNGKDIEHDQMRSFMGIFFRINEETVAPNTYLLLPPGENSGNLTESKAEEELQVILASAIAKFHDGAKGILNQD